ncbi:MAG: ABC transporter substrate-binding protein [Halobacteriales archaeon]
MSGLPGANSIEQTSKYLADEPLNALGVDAKVQVKEFLTFFSDLFANKRTQNMHINLTPPFLRFFDPHPILNGHTIKFAASTSNTHYANCEYSQVVQDQLRTGDPQRRQELVNEALSIASEDVLIINLISSPSQSAVRTDQIEPHVDAGQIGWNDRNVAFMMNVEATQGDDVILGTTTPGNIDAVEWWQSVYSIGWTQTVFSGLTYYGPQLDIQPHLATDWTINDEATRFEFSLREDATFHDGEPITSEDVKWTYEWLQANNAQIPDVNSWPYDTIETPDDHTVVVNMSSPNAAWFNAHVPMWGIFPKHQMVPAGAEETPLNVDIGNDEIIGSGPYQVRNFAPEEILDMRPYEGHWNTPPSNMVMRAFQDANSARRAFREGSINVYINITEQFYRQIQNELSDVAKTTTQPSITDWHVAPQHDFGPSKFRAFRMAVSQAIDRQFINQTFTNGLAEIGTNSSLLGDGHPWYPDNPDEVLTSIAPSKTGSVDAAKQTLREAGWGWDDQGRLHYPPDANLKPLWPKGKGPSDFPDRFPCVDELIPQSGG